MDLNLEELLEFAPKWFRDIQNKQLRPLLIFDKGYTDVRRFKRWTKNKINFIIPKKKNSLRYSTLEIVHFTDNEYSPQETLIWIQGLDQPLRRILVKKKKGKRKYWDLLTNNLNLSAKDIISLYTNRWSIEEVFNWLKQ